MTVASSLQKCQKQSHVDRAVEARELQIGLGPVRSYRCCRSWTVRRARTLLRLLGFGVNREKSGAGFSACLVNARFMGVGCRWGRRGGGTKRTLPGWWRSCGGWPDAACWTNRTNPRRRLRTVCDARVRVQAWGLQDWRIRGLARRLEHLET